MKIKIPNEVGNIIERLERGGYEAYVVGGAIRDILFGYRPKDWDIGTSASPDEIIDCLKETCRIFDKGIKHGTVGVICGGEEFEVTTFRIDKEYIDNRRPSRVEFTSSLSEDLRRRDFTINAMAYNHSIGLVDIFSGQEDMEKRIVRAVGDPYERFEEDALRIMRGIRLAREFKFHIDEETYRAMKAKGHLIRNISGDRIRQELDRILLSEKPSNGIRYLVNIDILQYIIPELQACIGFDQKNPHHTKDVFNHILDVVDNTKPDIILRLAALLHDIGKPQTFHLDQDGLGHFYGHESIGEEIAKKVLKRLNYSKKITKKVLILIRYHMAIHDFKTEKSIKRFINKVGVDNLEDLFELQLADKKSTKSADLIKNIVNIKDKYDKILINKQPMTLKELMVNGNDIKEYGISEGVLIGEILEDLLDRVIENPEIDQKSELEQIVKEKKDI